MPRSQQGLDYSLEAWLKVEAALMPVPQGLGIPLGMELVDWRFVGEP